MFELRPYHKNQITSWNPFSDMEEFEKRFFDNDYFGGRALSEFRTDITDEGDAFELKADLPGFKKEDIHLDIEGDNMTISAERHSEHEHKDKRNKYVRCERSYGSYQRSFDISGIRAERIKAKYTEGVLTLTLPKKDVTVSESRRLEIE